MDNELFTEPNDKIQDMVNKAVKKAVKKAINESNDSNDSNDYSPIVNMSSEITDAFKKGGYNRKESVYLTGQLLNGLAAMIRGLLS